MTVHTIHVARDFTPFPSGRFPEDGPGNGADFRDRHLAPPLAAGKTVSVVFDDACGFPHSFLDEAFGGLVRVCGLDPDSLRRQLQLRTSDPELQPFVDVAYQAIQEA